MMQKSLDKQIEYMKEEVAWYENKVISGKDWLDELNNCRAILKTLESLRDEPTKLVATEK